MPFRGLWTTWVRSTSDFRPENQANRVKCPVRLQNPWFQKVYACFGAFVPSSPFFVRRFMPLSIVCCCFGGFFAFTPLIREGLCCMAFFCLETLNFQKVMPVLRLWVVSISGAQFAGVKSLIASPKHKNGVTKQGWHLSMASNYTLAQKRTKNWQTLDCQSLCCSLVWLASTSDTP